MSLPIFLIVMLAVVQLLLDRLISGDSDTKVQRLSQIMLVRAAGTTLSPSVCDDAFLERKLAICIARPEGGHEQAQVREDQREDHGHCH